MSCEEINKLLAAYAIEALDDAEALRVDEHLSTCRKHDEELAELRGVVSGLSAVEEREPPAELRARLLRAFDDEVAQSRAPRPIRTTAADRGNVVQFVRRPAFAWLAAAALFLAVIGLTAWNVVLQTDDGEDAWTVSATVVGSGVDGHFWYSDSLQLAVVSMEEIPAAESGNVYQAWAIFEDQPRPVSLGVMPDRDTVAMKADLQGASTFAITIEPAGGSDQPTSDPIATASLG